MKREKPTRWWILLRMRMEHQVKPRLCPGFGRESLNAFGENRLVVLSRGPNRLLRMCATDAKVVGKRMHLTTWMMVVLAWIGFGLLCYAIILFFFKPTPLIDATDRKSVV